MLTDSKFFDFSQQTNFNRPKGKGGKMEAIIMAVVGVGLLMLSLFVLFRLSGLGEKRPNIKSVSLIIYFVIGMFLFGFGVQGIYVGMPKTSIKTGSYVVVGYVETTIKDGQPYYQMIVLEKDGTLRLYSLSKDMIDATPSGAEGGTLEVVEKSGLRKATLYLPIPGGGANPFP